MTRRQRLLKARAFARALALPVLVALVLRAFVAEAFVVPSESMEPTLQVGDRIIVDKRAYGLSLPWVTSQILEGQSPRLGDVVVFLDPRDAGTTLVKRVAALPGQSLSRRDGQLLVDGRAVGDVDDDSPKLPRGVIPAGHYLMLGDNRGNSADSRVFGLVPHRLLRGRVLRVAWSFTWESGLRWQRLFSTLGPEPPRP